MNELTYWAVVPNILRMLPQILPFYCLLQAWKPSGIVNCCLELTYEFNLVVTVEDCR